MTERQYQAQLIRRIKNLFPGCVVLKNDPQYQQGILDLTILWGTCWACLEVKPTSNSPHQPNQEWFVEQLNEMSFAAFIHPGNERQVLDELQEAFRSCRRTRVS